MNKIAWFILLSILIFHSFSCRTITCGNSFITPVFIGYSAADLDTIIVRKFESGTNFQTLDDTAIITNNPNVAGYITSNDTTAVNVNATSEEYQYLLPGNDWQLYLPSKNITISLSNIVSPQSHDKCFGDCGCINAIDSFMQNGREVIAQIRSVSDNNLTYGGYLMYINQ